MNTRMNGGTKEATQVNTPRMPPLLPTDLTGDEVRFGLLIANAIWVIANGVPMPKVAK